MAISRLVWADVVRRDAVNMPIKGQSEQAVRLPWAHLRIPPFPQVAIRILQLTNKEDVSLSQVSALISSEPAFSSEVLTIANSALYGGRFPVTNVLQAVAVLGTKNLRGICLTVGVRAYLGDSHNNPSLRAMWRHSLACALIAQQLARAGSISSAEAYTAGILHDIGRLALAVISAKEYASLLETYRGTAGSILQAERDLFGFDHCEVGRHLIQDWQLPANFASIVSGHHAPRQKGDAWRLSDLINVSCRMADSIGFAVFQGCERIPFADLFEELPERERKTFCSDVDALAFEVSSKINGIECL
jgi:HD-like signal output (HDOD) protein